MSKDRVTTSLVACSDVDAATPFPGAATPLHSVPPVQPLGVPPTKPTVVYLAGAIFLGAAAPFSIALRAGPPPNATDASAPSLSHPRVVDPPGAGVGLHTSAVALSSAVFPALRPGSSTPPTLIAAPTAAVPFLADAAPAFAAPFSTPAQLLVHVPIAPSTPLLRSDVVYVPPYRVRVSLHDGLLLRGTFVAFDRVMNPVHRDCVELYP